MSNKEKETLSKCKLKRLFSVLNYKGYVRKIKLDQSFFDFIIK